MPGEGFMLHMIQTMRSNRELLRSKRRKFQNYKSNRHSDFNKKVMRKKFSKQTIQNTIYKNRIKIKNQNRVEFMYSILFFTVLILIVSYCWKVIL